MLRREDEDGTGVTTVHLPPQALSWSSDWTSSKQDALAFSA
jgi:hypothetical protein